MASKRDVSASDSVAGQRFELIRTVSLNHDTARLTKLLRDQQSWAEKRGAASAKDEEDPEVSLDERWPSLVEYSRYL